jgi:hypothetical protein
MIFTRFYRIRLKPDANKVAALLEERMLVDLYRSLGGGWIKRTGEFRASG